MSRGLNKAMLIGNVGADPELRTTTGGRRVATFSLATGRRFATRDGGQQEKTEWHRIVAWDRLAETAERYVRRGERVYVEGRVEYRSWEDNAGHTRYATEIIAEDVLPLAAVPDGGGASWPPREAEAEQGSGSGRGRPGSPRATRPARDEEDDLPF
ncbi:MAG TPA: single-stranded DNA-binding protein [Longimicrobiales bacterium]|nr:single-stranded DNA-binding protein [Longimicrobiales bacterium]